MRNKNEKGFTLIELLVVIAIIGLLASVVLLALNSARAKSRDAKRLADIRQLASALELAYNDLNTYPATIAALVPRYIGLVPVAPTPADGNSSQTCSLANNNYQSNYVASASGALYTITFCLGDNTGGYPSGTHYLTPAGIQ